MIEATWIVATRLVTTAVLLSWVFLAYWFYAFSPIEINKEKVEVYNHGRTYMYVNVSRKTEAGLVFCGSPITAVVTEGPIGKRHTEPFNGTGIGTGDYDERRWRHTSSVHKTLHSGVITVWQQSSYPCLFGLVKVIYTPKLKFDTAHEDPEFMKRLKDARTYRRPEHPRGIRSDRLDTSNRKNDGSVQTSS